MTYGRSAAGAATLWAEEVLEGIQDASLPQPPGHHRDPHDGTAVHRQPDVADEVVEARLGLVVLRAVDLQGDLVEGEVRVEVLAADGVAAGSGGSARAARVTAGPPPRPARSGCAPSREFVDDPGQEPATAVAPDAGCRVVRLGRDALRCCTAVVRSSVASRSLRAHRTAWTAATAGVTLGMPRAEHVVLAPAPALVEADALDPDRRLPLATMTWISSSRSVWIPASAER
jgi:hypothetical protein